MSILARAAEGNPRGEVVFAAVCFAVALGAAAGLRLWRPARVESPERVPPDRSAWPLVVVLVAAVFCWWTISEAFVTYKHAALIAREGPEAKLDVSKFSPREMAFLAVVPPLAALALLLTGDLALRRMGGYDIGFGLRRLKSGISLGLLGSLCVVPLLFGFMVVLEWLYRAAGYEHPKEHDLLRALGATNDPAVEIPLLVGATLLAPLFEELLFRGHLQTVLRRVFPMLDPDYTKQSRQPPALGQPVIPAWATWAAVVVTSACFTLVHPGWTWPAIFLLSLCLGYAYERTGNLWVPIVIHAAFNSASTLLFLAGLN